MTVIHTQVTYQQYLNLCLDFNVDPSSEADDWLYDYWEMQHIIDYKGYYP